MKNLTDKTHKKLNSIKSLKYAWSGDEDLFYEEVTANNNALQKKYERFKKRYTKESI